MKKLCKTIRLSELFKFLINELAYKVTKLTPITSIRSLFFKQIVKLLLGNLL